MINLYFGPVINPKTLTQFDALPQCLIAVGSDGNIIWIEDDIDLSAVRDAIALRGLQDDEYTLVDCSAKSGEFIMPGLIDTHVHACQFPNLGVGGDDQLFDWLLNCVFPTEELFKDVTYAKSVYEDVIHRSIASGTTTSCYYGTLHLDATKALADIIHAKGQRAFVGKCNMDWDCPSYYIEETPEVSVKATKDLIQHIQGFALSRANEPLVHPIITPRFALSCSNELLEELRGLVKDMPNVAIQTHISENRKEIGDTLRRFKADSYAEVYDSFGLLRNNTILGHGVWLTEKEMDLIAERGAGVAHCPTSNFYLGSGMAKVGLLLDHGVKVGLGTDVGGGYNPSLLYTIQMASTASKMVAVQAELDEERRRHRCHPKHGKHGKLGKHHGHGHGKHGKRHRSDQHSESSSDSNSDKEAEGASNHEHHRHRHHRHGKHHKGAHERSDQRSESSSDSHSDREAEGASHREQHCHRHRRHGEHGARHHHHHHHDRHHYRGDHPDDDGQHAQHHHDHDCPSPPKPRFTNQKLRLETLLYLATLGGADVCALQDRIGSFAVGKAFDALHVSLDDALTGNPAVWGRGVDEREREPNERNLRRWLERFLFGGDNRNVRRVFVQGVLIGGADGAAGTKE